MPAGTAVRRGKGEQETQRVEVWRKLECPKNIEGGRIFLKAIEDAGKNMAICVSDAKGTFVDPSYLFPKAFNSPVFLVRVAVGKLELLSDSTVEKVYERVIGKGGCGLRKCPMWVPPILRLEYADQPLGENLIIVTEELIIPSCGNNPEMFCVKNYDNTLRLTTEIFPKDRILGPETILVFALPQQAPE